MAREVNFVKKESFLNNIYRRKKENDFIVLYYSKWDDRSLALIEYIQDIWVNRDGDETIHLVNSFELPHSFLAYSVTQVPCLIQGLKGKIRKTEYLPYIYKALSPNQGRNA
jgi:hypothetical protein|tara:strand:+ start:385 stop:717 length:333 start_codon:yes stop_codon:yes gene_type:complete